MSAAWWWAVPVVAAISYQAGRWLKRRDITAENRRDWREISDLKAKLRKLDSISPAAVHEAMQSSPVDDGLYRQARAAIHFIAERVRS